MSFINPSNTTISDILLYSSFILISISLYIQLIHNWQRKKVSGLSIDYILLGLLSYIYYLLFITGYHFILFYIPFIRLDSSIIDIIFSIHSLIGLLFITAQALFGNEKTYKQISIITWSLISISIAACFICIILPIMTESIRFDLGGYGLVIAFYLMYSIKYYPQIRFNHIRKSTIGLNVFCCVLDMGGNVLAAAYYIYNMSLRTTIPNVIWMDILGLICFTASMMSNAVLMLQHCVLYSNSNSDLGEHFFEHYLINRLD